MSEELGEDFARTLDDARFAARVHVFGETLVDPWAMLVELVEGIEGEIGDQVFMKTNELESERDAALTELDEARRSVRYLVSDIRGTAAETELRHGLLDDLDCFAAGFAAGKALKQPPEEELEMGQAQVPDSALTRMKQVIVEGNAPLLASLATLTKSVNELVIVQGAALKEARSIERLKEEAERIADEKIAHAAKGEPPPADYDMESAIKASGQWECGDYHCSEHDIGQNMDCLATYGLQADAEKHVGAIDDDDALRKGLHRTLRNIVPVEALTAPRNGVPKVTVTVASPPAPAQPTAAAKTTRARKAKPKPSKPAPKSRGKKKGRK